MGPIMGGYARAKFESAKYAMTFVGNSIADAGYGSDLVPQLQALAPISNQFTITNRALSGYGMTQLTSVASTVDSAYVAGKINYMVLFEITNTVYNDGYTGLQACAQMQTYIANRKALNPWRVILMTGIPRGSLFGSTWNATTGEAQMQAANAYIRANYRDMGAVAMVEARRVGGPFDFADSTNLANFPSSLWTDPTHPNSAGRAYLAQYIADVLKRLPAR